MQNLLGSFPGTLAVALAREGGAMCLKMSQPVSE